MSRMGRHEAAHVNKHRVAMTFVAVTLALAIGLVGTVAFMLLYPYKTAIKLPMPMSIAKGYETVRQGGCVVYEYDFVDYTDVVPAVHRQFIDGLIFDSALASMYLTPGSGHVRVRVPIPDTLPPGRYRIRVVSDFRMNVLRTISTVEDTDDFTVLPALGHPDAAKDASATP